MSSGVRGSVLRKNVRLVALIVLFGRRWRSTQSVFVTSTSDWPVLQVVFHFT